jgi:hypothetical protein
MGHQVRIFINDNDSFAIEDKIRKLEPMAVLHSRSDTNTPRTLPSLRFWQDGRRWLYFYLVRVPDLSHVRLHQARDHWSIDVRSSPVIEIHLSPIEGDIVRPGRAYFVDKFYDQNGILQTKDASFSKWARSVFKEIKSYLKRDDKDYFGPDALLRQSTFLGDYYARVDA